MEESYMSKKTKENISLLLFITPALIVFFIFKLFPTFSGIFYALTDWNGFNKGFNFVGLENFIEIFSDTNFWKSIIFTVKFVLVMTVLANLIPLFLAIAIESRPKGKGLFRTIFYMPNMISMIIGGYMWNFIFTKVLYFLADNFGMKFLDHSWIGDPNYAFFAIVIVALWGASGYAMLIYIAALKGVPINLIEAASLDGATKIQSFFYITLPMIRHAITICLFWILSTSFQVFDVIYSLTGGGPGRATESVAINIYEEAFRGNIRYGYATAKSTVLFFIVLMITIIQLKLTDQKDNGI